MAGPDPFGVRTGGRSWSRLWGGVGSSWECGVICQHLAMACGLMGVRLKVRASLWEGNWCELVSSGSWGQGLGIP